MWGCTHTVDKADVPKLRENTALKGCPSHSAYRGSENRGGQRDPQEFEVERQNISPTVSNASGAACAPEPELNADEQPKLTNLMGW